MLHKKKWVTVAYEHPLAVGHGLLKHFPLVLMMGLAHSPTTVYLNQITTIIKSRRDKLQKNPVKWNHETHLIQQINTQVQ